VQVQVFHVISLILPAVIRSTLWPYVQ